MGPIPAGVWDGQKVANSSGTGHVRATINVKINIKTLATNFEFDFPTKFKMIN